MNHFQLIVTSRIAEHKAKEVARIEAEREKIRAEEAAKAKAEMEEKIRADLVAINTAIPLTAAPTPTPTTMPTLGDVLHAVAPAAIANAIAPPRTAPNHMTGSAQSANAVSEKARLLSRLTEYVHQMTERELSNLVIHAAHVIANREGIAA